MTIVRGAVDEMLCLLPFLPAFDAAHLEDVRGAPGDDRPVLEGEPLARDPFRYAEELVLYQFGVDRLGRAADGESRQALDDR